MTEAWKPVVGYEGLYEVSSLGRVKRVAPASGTRPGTILKPAVMKSRGHYLLVGLSKGSVKKKFMVHRLVAAAFLGESDLPLVRHLDGNPHNNAVENLAWGTASENAYDRVRHGTHYYGNQNSNKTHCKYGHEFSPANTYVKVDRQGRTSRKCRVCIRRESRERRERQRA